MDMAILRRNFAEALEAAAWFLHHLELAQKMRASVGGS
jgi:hypothetical protein